MHEHVEERALQAVAQIVTLVRRVDTGGIIFVAGPLMSGKSIVAVDVARQLRAEGLGVAVGQPAVQRTDVEMGALASRAGRRLAAHMLDSAAAVRGLFAEARVVVVDEVQFLAEPLQGALRGALEDFSGWSIVTGLQYTSLRGEFPICAWLKRRAMVVFCLTATCTVCGRPIAKYSQRLIGGHPAARHTPAILPPSSDVRYEPRCAACHQV